MKNLDASHDFCSLAICEFGFIKDGFNFTTIFIGNDLIEFSNSKIRLLVFREPRSYMIYVQLTSVMTGETVVLDEILNALYPDKELTSQCCGNDLESTKACLSQLSQVCKENLFEIFDGNTGVFDKAALSALVGRHKYTLECQFGPKLRKANSAWEIGDWETARKLYLECIPLLSPVEKKRLGVLNQPKDQLRSD